MSAEPLFVDTSGWVALFDRTDRHHRRASAFWRGLRDERRRLLTSDYVLDETCTLLRRGRGGLPMAVAFHDTLANSRILEVADVDESLRVEAWSLFTRYDDKVLSFTDCTSFALLRRRNLFETFGFDEDFERAGFLLRP